MNDIWFKENSVKMLYLWYESDVKKSLENVAQRPYYIVWNLIQTLGK